LLSSFRRPIPLKTYAPGTLVKGKFTQGIATLSSVQASVQPATPNDVLTLPELRRNDKAYVLFTSTSLNMVNGNINPDRVTIDGEEFEVITKNPWNNGVINHFRYVVTKVKS